MKDLTSEAIRRFISRRNFLKGAGSLAAVPLLTGLGGSVLTGCSPSSTAYTGPGTRLVILGSSGGVGYWPGSTRASSSSALVVNGVIYLIDIGQGSTARLSEAFNTTSALDSNGQYIPPASSAFLGNVKALFFTHLHQDHIADYANFLLIGAGTNLGNYLNPSNPRKGWGANPLQVIGPCNRGQLDNNNNPLITDPAEWVINAYSPTPPSVTPTPGTRQMTDMIWQAFAQAINDLMLDDGYPNYRSLVDVREIGTELASRDSNTCPKTDPFQIYPAGGGKDENGVSVWATLVDHRQVYPAFAYRFETNHGTVVFSGDTGPNTTEDRDIYPPDDRTANGNLQVLATMNGGADILVHEVIDSAWIDAHFQSSSQAALKTHMQRAHTQIEYVGQVAAYCKVKTLILNHIIPGMAPISHLLRAQQNFQGNLIISEDLMQIDVSKAGGRVIANNT